MRIERLGKIERRLGANLWGRPNSVVNTRRSRPGQHGTKPSRLSDYALKLKEKQKLKMYYNIMEKQLRILLKQVQSKKGNPVTMLVQQLERRLQTVVYRAKWCGMIAARQLISHGHVLVNGQRVDIRSYKLNEGDVVSLSDKTKEMKIIGSYIETCPRKIPVYIDAKSPMEVVFARVPDASEVLHECNINVGSVVEVLSR